MNPDSSPDAIVAIDWSGSKTSSGQRKHIRAALWQHGRITLHKQKTRDEWMAWLIALAHSTPRLVVGVDFCFSYPAWFLHQKRCPTAPDFWSLVAREGEHWLSAACADRRFWGAHRRKIPPQFSLQNYKKMFRQADLACKVRSHILSPVARDKVKGIAPKSPFQIGGAGAVGTGSLRGIPHLPALRAAGFSIWPFDAPSYPLLVEIYPRLLTGEVHKKNADARRRYLRDRRASDPLFHCIAHAALREAASSEDAFDALISVVEMVRRRSSFTTLRRATDPTTRLEGAVWGAGQG